PSPSSRRNFAEKKPSRQDLSHGQLTQRWPLPSPRLSRFEFSVAPIDDDHARYTPLCDLPPWRDGELCLTVELAKESVCVATPKRGGAADQQNGAARSSSSRRQDHDRPIRADRARCAEEDRSGVLVRWPILIGRLTDQLCGPLLHPAPYLGWLGLPPAHRCS